MVAAKPSVYECLGQNGTETELRHTSYRRVSSVEFSPEYPDVLYVKQAGFIGSWGEWHSSKTNLHRNATATRAIVQAELFDLLPVRQSRMIKQNSATSGFEMCFAIGSQHLWCRGSQPKHVSNPA